MFAYPGASGNLCGPVAGPMALLHDRDRDRNKRATDGGQRAGNSFLLQFENTCEPQSIAD
jgi:hypothetical protein